MTSFNAMNEFARQLERAVSGTKFKTKVIVTPTSIEEKGLVIKVSLLKTVLDTRTEASKSTRTIRLRVSVCGTAESLTGLEQALEAIEKLDVYLSDSNLRLETIVEGSNGMNAVCKIPNTRIRQVISEEDSFIDSPDSTQVQDVEDSRMVLITIPQEVAND